MCVITCPAPDCKQPGAQLVPVPIPHTDDTADAASCLACGLVWAVDPGADGSCRDCGGSGTVWGAARQDPLCPCHESHTAQQADPEPAPATAPAGPDEEPSPPASSPPAPSTSWRRTVAVLLATIVSAGIALAAGAEMAWWIYQNPPLNADTEHQRFAWAFAFGAAAMAAVGSLGGAAVDQVERWGKDRSSSTWS